MFWPDRGSGVPVEPARRPVASAVRQYFTEGGAGQAPTVPGGDWFNQVTNELLNVLAAASIDPSKVDDDQLAQAIQSISQSANDALREDLADDDGTDLVMLKPSEINTAMKRALTDVIYDQVINVKWFADGLEPNWNAQTQTGNDFTAAIQAAITFFATLGTKRAGGKRAIMLPAGHFKISALTIPAAMGFGIDFIGAGKNATVVWSDHTNPNPAITSEIESVNFRSMSLFGALSETSNSANWKGCFYKGKLASNAPDIDVMFSDCIVGYAVSFAQVYGRGCIFNAGTTAVRCINLLEIVADASTVFTSGTNAVQTGMRHYCFYGLRTDFVSKLILITGTGPQISHINGIQIVGCDFLVMDRLISGDTATIQRAVVANNESKKSFSGGVVSVGGVIDCVDTGNSWCKDFNTAAVPTAVEETIRAVWISQGVIRGLTILGTTATGIREWVVRANGPSSDITITSCRFPEFGTVKGASSDTRVFEGLSSCDRLNISDNSYSSSSPSGTVSLFNTTIQFGRVVCRGNQSGQQFSDPRQIYNPNLKVNGVVSVTPPSAISGRVRDLTQTHVTVDFQILITPSEASGALSLVVPTFIPAIADNSGIASGYSGSGLISVAEGFGGTPSPLAPVRINPLTQEMELWLAQGPSGARLDASHRTGQIILRGTATYRYA